MEDKLRFLANYLRDNFSYTYTLSAVSKDNIATKISFVEIPIIVEYYEDSLSFTVTNNFYFETPSFHRFFSATQVIEYIITRKYEVE